MLERYHNALPDQFNIKLKCLPHAASFLSLDFRGIGVVIYALPTMAKVAQTATRSRNMSMCRNTRNITVGKSCRYLSYFKRH